jgi:hypothetical protein
LQIAEQAKKQLDDARRQLDEAQKQAEAARLQVEETKRLAAADAQARVEQAKREARDQEAKLAALTPNQPVPVPAPASPQMDQADIARLLQAHLKRVGCDPGNSDGNWDDSSKKALDLFNKNAQTKFDIKLASLDALDAVRGKSDRVCPLVCARGQKADGDRCVQIGCSAGYFLNSNGACEKRQEPAPKPKTATREAPATRAAPAASRGGKCFSFSGKTYCE